jgi:predicted XRE-type DNA-binding protein
LRLAATNSLSEEALTFDGPYENVWDAILDDEPAERERQKMLTDLWIAIEQRIKEKGWTQKEAAKRMDVTQPRVSDLLRGKLDLFSIDSLVAMAGAAGIRVKLIFTSDS